MSNIVIGLGIKHYNPDNSLKGVIYQEVYFKPKDNNAIEAMISYARARGYIDKNITISINNIPNALAVFHEYNEIVSFLELLDSEEKQGVISILLGDQKPLDTAQSYLKLYLYTNLEISLGDNFLKSICKKSLLERIVTRFNSFF